MGRKRTTAPWGNRIIGHGTKPAGDFLANEANWRVHPASQQEALDGVLSDVGFVQSVIVNKRSDAGWGQSRNVETVIDGHCRIGRALDRGEDTPVPFVYVDLSPAEERRVLLTLDPIGAMATVDDTKLEELLAASVEDFTESSVDLDAILKRCKRHVEFEARESTNVLVVCSDSNKQAALIEELRERGWMCKPTSRS